MRTNEALSFVSAPAPLSTYNHLKHITEELNLDRDEPEHDLLNAFMWLRGAVNAEVRTKTPSPPLLQMCLLSIALCIDKSRERLRDIADIAIDDEDENASTFVSWPVGKMYRPVNEVLDTVDDDRCVVPLNGYDTLHAQ